MKNLKTPAIFAVAFGVLCGYMIATGTISSLFGADDKKAVAQNNAPQITGVLGTPKRH